MSSRNMELCIIDQSQQCPDPDPQDRPGRAAAGAGPQIFGAVTVFLLHSPAERASVRMARRPSLRDFLRPGAEGRSLPRNWL